MNRAAFEGTAAYYERYRLDYPRRLIARVAGLAGLKPGDAVLDLGCGTGMLAIAFARLGMAVTAMDPEPEMLAAAEAAADAAGVPVTLRAGRLVRPDAGRWAVPAGGDGPRLSLDGPCRDLGHAGPHRDAGRRRGAVSRRASAGGGKWLVQDPAAHVQDKFGLRPAARGEAGGHRRYEPFLFASAFTAAGRPVGHHPPAVDGGGDRGPGLFHVALRAGEAGRARARHSRPSCRRPCGNCRRMGSSPRSRRWWRFWRGGRK